jgi:outer membrane protein assembly factor BamE (lipoprotein component of BamABCDE complex)
MLKLLTFVTIILSITSCSPTEHVRGTVFEIDQVKKIVPNLTTLTEVHKLLGPPSSITLFRKKSWLYIGEETTTVSFFDPKIQDRKTLIITFNDDDTVASYEIKEFHQGHTIKPNDDSTKTYGNDPSLLSELFGNIGKYDPPSRVARKTI